MIVDIHTISRIENPIYGKCILAETFPIIDHPWALALVAALI